MKSLRQLLDKPGLLLGTWIQIPAAEVVEMAARAGFDFAIMDLEHGDFNVETAASLVRASEACGIAPMIRLPEAHAPTVTRALDTGAAAVVLPRVTSLEDAQHAVRTSLFAPRGSRGACPIVRSGEHLISDFAAFRARQEADFGAILLLETETAFDVVEDICAIAGLRGLMLGPFDLSVAMGLDGNYQHAAVQARLNAAIDVARRASVPIIMPVFALDAADCKAQMNHWQARGVRMFAVGADKIFFADYVSRYVSRLRE